MSEGTETTRGFDLFELLTALLLGLAAIGASISGLQSNQWGGRQLDAFAEANTLTTKASTQYNEDTVLMNADYAAIATAKEHLIEAREAKDRGDRAKHLELASYFYTTQLTHNGYKAMELPASFYVEDEEEAAKPAAPGAAAKAPSKDEEGEEEEGAEKPASGTVHGEEAADIPDAALLASLDVELDEAYADEMLEEGKEMFAAADKKFSEGRVANDNGDKFEFVSVLFTVALFFAGLGLVFKTSMRWKFLASGAVIFLGSVGYMFTLPWAG